MKKIDGCRYSGSPGKSETPRSRPDTGQGDEICSNWIHPTFSKVSRCDLDIRSLCGGTDETKQRHCSHQPVNGLRIPIARHIPQVDAPCPPLRLTRGKTRRCSLENGFILCQRADRLPWEACPFISSPSAPNKRRGWTRIGMMRCGGMR